MLFQQGFSTSLIIVAIILGFLAAFLDSSMGMGYGLLAPVLMGLGLDPYIVVPILLLSQMTTGFTGTIFHSLYHNIDFKTSKTQDTKTTILFILIGFLGMVLAVLVSLNISTNILLLYIGILMIGAGIVMLPKLSFSFSWKRIMFLNGLASFNKAISGGGYGPIMTVGQMTSGRDVRESVAFTDFTEAFLSGFGFLLYLIFNEYYGINIVITIKLGVILIISGMIATPLGALITKKLKKKSSKKIVGALSILIGIFTLGKIIFF